MKIHYKSPSEESALVSESNSKNSDPRKYLKNMTIITLVAIGIIMITINYKFLHTNEKNKPIMIESKLTRNKYPLNTNYKEYMTRQKKNNRGYLKLLMSTNAKKILSSVPEGSIFVLKDNSVLTDEEACSIEATLKAFPQRKVCILELSCGNYTEDDTGIMNFTKFLQTRNANMLRLRVDGEEYFKDSPLKGKWICDNDKSLFGAMALTVWVRGGMAFFPEIIIIKPELINSEQTIVSKYMIISHSKARPFLLEIMTGIKPQNIIDIEKYLEQKVSLARKSNKMQEINVLNGTHICNHPNKICDILIIEDYKQYSGAWIVDLRNFCPAIIKNFQENKSYTLQNT